ncbi:MAG: DMT family transporter [Planctomycetota bacterium]
MNWFLLSLSSAFFVTSADALCKRSLKQNGEYLIAWVRIGFAAPLLLLLLPFIEIPSLDLPFFLALLISVPLEVTALILYTKAIKLSPLSLTLPFLALSPVFMIFTSDLMLGERLGKLGIISIFLATAGAYLLNVNTTKNGILEPFKAIRRERGSLYMILVAFIYSITSNLGKMAIIHSSPLFFAATYLPILAIVFFPIVMWKNHGNVKELFVSPKTFGAIGLAMAISVTAHVLAVNMMAVPYVISVKRLSLLFGIMYGAIWFKETHIKERLLGAIIMISGVIMLAFI